MTTTSSPRSLFEKIWSRHEILRREDGQSLLYVDRHLVQDGSAPAFEMLRQQGLTIRAPQSAFATPDHYVPTSSRELERKSTRLNSSNKCASRMTTYA